MIKKGIILLIDIYQVIFSALLKNLLGNSKFCRFSETCSAYIKRMIVEKGLAGGLAFGFARLLRCHPFHFPFEKAAKEVAT